MKIHYNKENLSNLSTGFLFLDTSSLIAIISYKEEFAKIISSIKEQGRAFVTIPSIAFEFTRLYCCLFCFRGSLLLTENHKNFTPTILNRNLIFTIDREERDIRNIAMYEFSHLKYEKDAAAILKEMK